jgi:hypothetical protein
VCFSDQQKHDNRKICPCVSREIGHRYVVPAGSGASLSEHRVLQTGRPIEDRPPNLGRVRRQCDQNSSFNSRGVSTNLLTYMDLFTLPRI